jgi:drug/metabolite transporter (DMT)-like permease
LPSFHHRGVVLALGSALASTGVYLVSRWFLAHETALLDFLFVWFGAGFVYTGAAFVFTGNLPILARSFRAWPYIFLFGAGNFVSVLLFFGAVRLMDPASVAWVSQLDFAFAAFLGIVWLRERVTAKDAAGFACVLAGALTLAVSVRELAGMGLWMALGSAAIEGVMAAGAKRLHTAGVPGEPFLDMRTLAFHRTWGILAGVMFARLFHGLPAAPWDMAWERAGGIALGALFGPALGFGLYYMALARTEVHRAATVKSIQPILVLALAWLMWDLSPPTAGIAGGVLVTLGVILVFPRKGK